MYLWVVLATFMVAILSYNLSVRPDSDYSYMETRAQTAITKFKAQHNAFYSYIDSKRLSVTQQAHEDKVIYYSGVGYHNGQAINPKGRVSITTAEMEGFLPIGYQARPDIYSKVYCFKMSNEGNILDADYKILCENDSISLGQDVCCSSASVAVYVVSWQPISSNWLNEKGLPTADMMAVMTKSDGYGRSFGYNQRDKELESSTDQQQSYVISGGYGYVSEEDKISTVKHQRIFSAVLSDDDYNSSCGNSHTCFVAIQKVQNREGM